jgi:hypothetical protein
MPGGSDELIRVDFKDIYICFIDKDNKFEEDVIMIVGMYSAIYIHIFRRY